MMATGGIEREQHFLYQRKKSATDTLHICHLGEYMEGLSGMENEWSQRCGADGPGQL